MASSQRGDLRRNGYARQILQMDDPLAAGLIQTVPDAVRTSADVPRTWPVDGQGDRPFSMPDVRRRRTEAARIVASQYAAVRNAVDQVAVSRN